MNVHPVGIENPATKLYLNSFPRSYIMRANLTMKKPIQAVIFLAITPLILSG
jgi:hypothetical protein